MNLTNWNPAAVVRAEIKQRPERARGTWHYKGPDYSGALAIDDTAEALAHVRGREEWRYCGPHPMDDTAAPDAETVERFVVVSVRTPAPVAALTSPSSAGMYADHDRAAGLCRNDRRCGLRSHVVRVLLPLPPADPPMATVTGTAVAS